MIPAAVLGALVVAGCGDDGGGAGDPDGSTPLGAVALYQPVVPGSGAEWGVMPFPSDLYLNADGGIELITLPSGEFAIETAEEQLKEALREVKGFGVASNVYFPTSAAIDEASLAGKVALFDLETGAGIPVETLYREDLGAIIASMPLGISLRENHRYGAVMRRGVKDTRGRDVRADAAFEALLDLAQTPADAATAAAQESLRPLLELVDAPAELIAATVFTTEEITTTTKTMCEMAASTTPLIDPDPGEGLAALEVIGDDAGELDAVFGPADPGDVAGHIHFARRAQPHGSVAMMFHGTIDVPSFLSAEFATDGIVELDSEGAPIIKGTQPARFTIVLPQPSGDSYANLPVVVWIHGINRTRGDLSAIAEPATSRGFAVVAIDLLHHGHRRKNWVDEKNNTWDAPATDGKEPPDGFADQVELLPAVNFFHLVTSGGWPQYHPLPMRENMRQSAVDLCSLASFIESGDFTVINQALAAAGLPDDLSFRGTELGIVTESFGSLMGLLATAIDSRYDLGIFASPASSFPYPTLVHSPNFSQQFTPIILGPQDAEDRTTLGDPRTGGRWEPILNLWNTVLQTGDPVVYAPYILNGQLRGDDGANIILAQSWSDEWVPNEGVEHLVGVMGIPVLDIGREMDPPGDVFRFVDLPVQAAPIEGNVSGGKRTAVHTFWYPAAHALVRKMEEGSDYEVGFPPFVRRSEQLKFPSPVEKVQTLWGTFFAEYWNGDETPTAFDPWE